MDYKAGICTQSTKILAVAKSLFIPQFLLPLFPQLP